jgi:hypothetical protein
MVLVAKQPIETRVAFRRGASYAVRRSRVEDKSRLTLTVAKQSHDNQTLSYSYYLNLRLPQRTHSLTRHSKTWPMFKFTLTSPNPLTL